jgi:hypothetical protein
MLRKYFNRGIITFEKYLLNKQNSFKSNLKIQKKGFSSLDNLEIIQTKVDRNSQIFQVKSTMN